MTWIKTCALLMLCMLFVRPIVGNEKQPNLFLLTVNHSGSMWTLYSMHSLTHRRIVDCNLSHLKCWHQLYNYRLKIDQSLSPLYFAHTIEMFENVPGGYLPERDKLIVVLRNYKEVFLSIKLTAQKALEALQAQADDRITYRLIRNLNTYESWPEEKRLLIYFEDLMTNPKGCYEKILAFTGDSSSRLNQYLSDIQIHRDRSIQLYNSAPKLGQARSKGACKYHSEKTTLKQLKCMDECFRKLYPNLWKYFERFKSE